MLGRIGGEATSRRSSTDSAAGMIAATALEHDLTVITRNVRDFGL
jgi:predicted nucleic acid-binding protein